MEKIASFFIKKLAEGTQDKEVIISLLVMAVEGRLDKNIIPDILYKIYKTEDRVVQAIDTVPSNILNSIITDAVAILHGRD